MQRMIDVSKYQPDIDYAKVKAAGIEGVIIRCGITYWGEQQMDKDPYFEQHYAGFKSVGIPVGAYYYSAADNNEVAKREAEYCKTLLAGKQFELPVYYDVENNERMGNLSKDALTQICNTFCDTMEASDYFVGIYSNTNYFTNKLNFSELSQRYTIWLADFRGENANQTLKRDIWQYSSTGRIDGISGNVDLDECYRDFPPLMKEYGKNGFGKETEQPQLPVYTYTTGIYEVTADRLNVRMGPGKSYRVKPLSELTESAREQGGYVKGVLFTAQEIRNLPGESWARTPSGWVCIQNQDGTYAKRAEESLPTYSYTIGTYQVTATERMNVRTGPGTNYRIKPLSELTVSAREQGGYRPGVLFTAQEIRNLPGESWARTPSGWVCLQNKDGIYCKKIS
jgi:GH25 family lysozyme M1 (1,4-beta-N-acetylmuramidase)